MKRQYGTYLLNGEIVGPLPIGLKSKLQFEKSARARGWKADEDYQTTASFLTWHAAKLAGQHNLSYDEFVEQVEDIEFKAEETRPTEPERSPEE